MPTYAQIKAIWASGATLRWHTNPSHALRQSQDSVAGHQCRCAQLLLCLNPTASARLISVVLHHDVPEAIVGDLPGPAKRRWPDLKAASVAAENDRLADLGLITMTNLTKEEQAWLGLVDQFDSYLWVRHIDPARLESPDWKAHRVNVMFRAAELGCGSVVAEILDS
jgi:hypothetical protein